MKDLENNFAKQVVFKVEKKEVATVTVNGVAVETQTIEYIAMKCPDCGAIIEEYDSNVSMIDIYKSLADKSPVQSIPQYCNKCGCKLMCDKSVVDEVTITDM